MRTSSDKKERPSTKATSMMTTMMMMAMRNESVTRTRTGPFLETLLTFLLSFANGSRCGIRTGSRFFAMRRRPVVSTHSTVTCRRRSKREKKCNIRIQLRARSTLESKKNRFFFTFSESTKNIDLKNIFWRIYVSFKFYWKKFAKLTEL